MSKVLRIAVPVVLALGIAQSAGATTTHSYKPAAHARCRADFVKRTERVKVHGKFVREAMCVYVAPQVLAIPVPPAPAPVVAPVVTTTVPETTTTVAPTTIDVSLSFEITERGGNNGPYIFGAEAVLAGLPTPESWPVVVGTLTLSFGPPGPWVPTPCQTIVTETPSNDTFATIQCDSNIMSPKWGITLTYGGGWYTATNGDIIVLEPVALTTPIADVSVGA